MNLNKFSLTVLQSKKKTETHSLPVALTQFEQSATQWLKKIPDKLNSDLCNLKKYNSNRIETFDFNKKKFYWIQFRFLKIYYFPIIRIEYFGFNFNFVIDPNKIIL